MSTDQLIEQSTVCFREALSEKSTAIMSALADSAEGKHSFSVGVKLTKTKGRVYIAGTLRHTTKDSVDFEQSFEIDDPGQLKLGSVDGSGE
jgi:hypothetical protein